MKKETMVLHRMRNTFCAFSEEVKSQSKNALICFGDIDKFHPVNFFGPIPDD